MDGISRFYVTRNNVTDKATEPLLSRTRTRTHTIATGRDRGRRRVYTYRIRQVAFESAGGLFGMIEPENFDLHSLQMVFPHAVDFADKRPVGLAGRQEHGAIANLLKGKNLNKKYTS